MLDSREADDYSMVTEMLMRDSGPMMREDAETSDEYCWNWWGVSKSHSDVHSQ